jgi:REP element-mobilizing transposase RayT
MRHTRQRTFDFPYAWGGRRHGAGRKPKGARAGVSHKTRPALAARFPAHVTLRVRAGLPSLRNPREFGVVRRAFRAGCVKLGYRLVHFSVLGNHAHLLVEAGDKLRLARGMQGLAIRTAKRLNQLWCRKGSVFADRYHARILRTPREVRRALAYVLNNARRHGIRLPADAPDPCSSGAWFDGWRERIAALAPDARATTAARTWLLSLGWRRHGLLGLAETPGG